MRQSPPKKRCPECGARDVLVRGRCMNCFKELLLQLQREQGNVVADRSPTDKEIHMTDTQPDITEVPAEEVAPAPSEAPYVAPPTADPEASAEPAPWASPPATSPDEPTAESGADAAPVADPPSDAVKAARRARIDLEGQVKGVCDEFVSGGFTLGENETLTPHRIARRLESKNPDVKISTGAVSGVLDRWVEYGFANVADKPKAFVDYTDEGRTKGLKALKAEAHQAKRERKAAIKAAEASA